MKPKDIIRRLANNWAGNRVSASYVIMIDSYCSYYWSIVKWDVTFEEWQAAVRLNERHRHYCRWMKEGRHGWTATGKATYWADNSVDVEQVSALTGEARMVQAVAPHGDLCF